MKLPTIIWRHKKENRKKCSLTSLEAKEGFLFFRYPYLPFFTESRYLLLEVGAPVLTEKDQDMGIFVIDGTWKYAEAMKKKLPPMQTRSLPSHYQTAYPRKQTGCPFPEEGLASIEALFLTYYHMGKDTKGLLDHYYWKGAFLAKNKLLHLG